MKVTLISLVMMVSPIVMATLGVDYSVLVSKDELSCIKEKGYDFVVPRGYTSYGVVDPNIKTNLQNARSAGMKTVDVYMFPCVPCGDPKSQVDEFVNGLKRERYSIIWIVVKVYNWDRDIDKNQIFLKGLTDEFKNKKKSIGILTTYFDWDDIMGLNYVGAAEFPLWYLFYDGNPDFSDYAEFGGWSNPSIKQYKGDANVCGIEVNLSYSA